MPLIKKYLKLPAENYFSKKCWKIPLHQTPAVSTFANDVTQKPIPLVLIWCQQLKQSLEHLAKLDTFIFKDVFVNYALYPQKKSIVGKSQRQCAFTE
jgi:hypothetical protein